MRLYSSALMYEKFCEGIIFDLSVVGKLVSVVMT